MRELLKVRIPKRLKEILEIMAEENEITLTVLCNILLEEAIYQTLCEEREYGDGKFANLKCDIKRLGI